MTSPSAEHRSGEVTDRQIDDERQREVRCGLARNPALPASLIDQLNALGDAAVCLELTDRDDLSEVQVHLLARSGDAHVIARLMERGLLSVDGVDRFEPQVVIAMAGIAPVRRDWLWEVAADQDPAVRAALASTAYLPADVVAVLADDPDVDVVAEAAAPPSLPEPVAQRLVFHPHVSVRRALACNERAPVHLLVALAERRPPAAELCPACDGSGHWPAEHCSCDGTHQDALDDLDYALTLNSRTPVETLDRFAAHRSMHVRWQLASRTDLQQSTYRALVQDPIRGVRGDVAANPAISEQLIRDLADEVTFDVRRRLAHNPAIPLDVLAELAPSAKIGSTLLSRIASATPAEIRDIAASTVPVMRMLLAERHDLPRQVVDQLADDRDAKVLKSLATNPVLTQGRLETMVAAHGPRVAARVAANPSCPPDLLLRLARQTPPVQKALRRIAGHPNAPAEALLACLADPRARRIATSHPAMPVETIIRLLTDADTGVAAAAAANPSLPEAAMRHLAAAR